jgi:NAD(P)-dependent dehydrogenase (short-subunit alcohol dehydrogenase family)|tara:strand:- start:162 stop:995 length:834 start_codon:yes stop_codon:yes gene_type:complete
MSFEKYNLTGKTALITGSAGLLGLQNASALLEAGAQVVLTDIKSNDLLIAKQELEQTFNNQLIHIHNMDVTSKENIQEAFKDLKNQNIRIDILINNAAIDPKVDDDSGIIESSRLEEFDLAQWNLQINVGLTGAFLCSQVFGSAMANDGKGGVILNIASDLSVISPDQRLYFKEGIKKSFQPVKPVTYSVIKAGLVGLTKYLATYWPEEGVRCNALSPGGIYNGQGNDFVSRVESLIPMGRMAEKDEYRSTVQYMCSDASTYMNGQNIVVDGGRSVW